MDRQGSENDRSQEGEDEEFRIPGLSAENWLTSSPSQTREGLEARKVTPPGPPAQIEESQPAEVPAEEDSREVIRR
ncbi:hypothetical protein NDU88_002752 [Pleurodeles waltl]|uniref:Uncharacterized protein n=1 Tax=Pleurodeles waltl TaxID=8319 RepID=A0AAV7UYL7_PLEWA|nr:hypothetical protein NDU88_002752 [Pleurodeles waltl]